jgi:hypothetical protein
MEPNKNDSSKKLMIASIMALLLIIGVALYFVISGRQDNATLTEQKTALDSTFKSLSDTLDVRSLEIDNMTANNVKLDSSLVASQALIASEKKQIAGLLSKVKMTKAELTEAQGMISQYQTSISDLQKKVVELTAQNQQLTQNNQQLTQDLTSEKKTTSELNQENKGLSEKVTVGSLLQLTQVDVTGVKDRQNGKETTVKNAKAVESIRISFETGVNKILATGPLSLYVRVINPKGETVSVASQGSGSLQLAQSNTQMQYTKKADIDWNQSNKKVVVYCKQNMSGAGTYKVEIYQSGYLIGNGAVKFN